MSGRTQSGTRIVMARSTRSRARTWTLSSSRVGAVAISVMSLSMPGLATPATLSEPPMPAYSLPKASASSWPGVSLIGT